MRRGRIWLSTLPRMGRNGADIFCRRLARAAPCCPDARIQLLRSAIPLHARQPAQAASSAGVLQNQDIIKMVKGVSAAVLKAAVAAGKQTLWLVREFHP